MKSLIVLGEDDMFYRLEPFGVFGMEEVLSRMASQTLPNSKNHTAFNVAVGCDMGSIRWAKSAFHLALTKKGEPVYWGYLPGLVLSCRFGIVEHNGKPRIVPDFGKRIADSTEDRLFAPASVMLSSECVMRYLMVIPCVPHISGKELRPYLAFHLSDVRGAMLGNFLPMIPNVFNDARVCMGSGFEEKGNPNKGTEEEVQRAITWFFESKANGDLVDSETDRAAAAEKLFGWDKLKNPVAPIVSPKSLLNIKVGHYYLDSLPYSTTGY